MIKYYKPHPVEFMTDITTVNEKTMELTEQQKNYLSNILV